MKPHLVSDDGAVDCPEIAKSYHYIHACVYTYMKYRDTVWYNKPVYGFQVHINLGAGETEIASEAPFLLNDMKWHAVNLTRRGSQLTIQVDSHLTK